MAARKYKPLKERFLAKIEISTHTGCWDWTASATLEGYGNFWCAGKVQLAHRVSYELHCGPIPNGDLVCHRCDNPGCVNPAHLFLGTNTENMADMVAKGRQLRVRGIAHGRAKLTEADVISIRSAEGISLRGLAKQYGVSKGIVCHIRAGRNWTHLICV